MKKVLTLRAVVGIGIGIEIERTPLAVIYET
jgi:hypothetical protein